MLRTVHQNRCESIPIRIAVVPEHPGEGCAQCSIFVSNVAVGVRDWCAIWRRADLITVDRHDASIVGRQDNLWSRIAVEIPNPEPLRARTGCSEAQPRSH